MTKKNTKYARGFSFSRPVTYQGIAYPSADSMITDEYGRKTKGTIFTDAYGRYYTKDKDNNIFSVVPVENLDEVVATAPNKRKLHSVLGDNYLTMSNDNTRIDNLPHREYNQHLKANAERGAREHALWDKEHPNLSAWRDAATAVPFAVASAPLVLGTGQGLLGTTAGQAVKHGLAALMENPYVAGVNDAIGLGFTGKGAYDVTQGKFTPETALDLAGGAGLLYKGIDPLLSSFSRNRRAIRNTSEIIPTGNEVNRIGYLSPEEEEFQGLFGRSMAEDAAMASRSTTQESAPARLIDDYANSIEEADRWERWQMQRAENARSTEPNIVFDDEGNPFLEGTTDDNTVRSNSLNTMSSRGIDGQELPFLSDGTPNPNYTFTPENDILPADPVIENWQDIDLGFNDPVFDVPLDKVQEFKARNVLAGESPYTEEEINALVNPDGTLKDGIYFTDKTEAGSHGDFFNAYKDSPTSLLQKYLYASDPAVKRREMKSIMEANPKGRSGILVHTHDGNTSMDSTPLAYKMATRLGKNFKPLAGGPERVLSNDFGYVNAFKNGYGAEANRARALFKANPNYEAKLLRDSNNNMTAFELEDENGVFQIPLNTREETLKIMNDELHNFNDYYGTNYSDIVPHKIFSKSPWSFGQYFDLPNIYGIAYKQGGKIKRRLLTSL